MELLADHDLGAPDEPQIQRKKYHWGEVDEDSYEKEEDWVVEAVELVALLPDLDEPVEEDYLTKVVDQQSDQKGDQDDTDACFDLLN